MPRFKLPDHVHIKSRYFDAPSLPGVSSALAHRALILLQPRLQSFAFRSFTGRWMLLKIELAAPNASKKRHTIMAMDIDAGSQGWYLFIEKLTEPDEVCSRRGTANEKTANLSAHNFWESNHLSAYTRIAMLSR